MAPLAPMSKTTAIVTAGEGMMLELLLLLYCSLNSSSSRRGKNQARLRFAVCAGWWVNRWSGDGRSGQVGGGEVGRSFLVKTKRAIGNIITTTTTATEYYYYFCRRDFFSADRLQAHRLTCCSIWGLFARQHHHLCAHVKDEALLVFFLLL